MITFEKQENGVLFTFENSDKYLYGDGTILVPFNSLAVIQDESDMITLRKSASWDIFLSGRFDTDFNYGSKEDAVDALKEALFDETGGVTEEEVEQMIDAATSGIPSSQVIEQLRNDVNAVSGEVASKADESSLTAVNDALTAHTANTNIHVTSTDKSNWDAKQDALTAGENITISGNVISAEAGNNIIELTQEEYDALVDKDPDALYIITDAQEINMNDYATKTEVDNALSGKADTSAVTAVSGTVSSLSGEIDALQGDISILSGDIDDLTRNKADESIVVALQGDVSALSGEVQTKLETSDFNAYSAATDARIAEDEEVTAAALNDLAETVSGKQETLISGENIKTINNISILGEGNITISGGGGGDYQYYSEDTTNESATIEVGEQSLTVDGNGVYVNNSPVVTAEELDDNYYTQQVIDEKEEVIASALTELNLRVTEDEEVTAAALNDLQENKADTSAVTAAIDDAKAYYISFATLATVGIHDEDWNDIVAAIDDHRPIYAGYPRTDGGIIYYGVECMNKNSGNTQIVMTASDDNQHYFYTFVKNGSNDYSYTVDTRPYTTNQEKTEWSAKQDALSAGTGIEISGNVISATGGGGATYSAGANISIDTANTINCTLPITANTNNKNVTVGYNLNVRQDGESSIGIFNVNRFVNATTHSENTIFTVGNGGSNYYRHNALEIRKNGDLYFADTSNNGQSYYEKPMVRLQDMYAALGGLKFVKLTQAEYDALVTKDSSTLYIISD